MPSVSTCFALFFQSTNAISGLFLTYKRERKKRYAPFVLSENGGKPLSAQDADWPQFTGLAAFAVGLAGFVGFAED